METHTHSDRHPDTGTRTRTIHRDRQAPTMQEYSDMITEGEKRREQREGRGRGDIKKEHAALAGVAQWMGYL